MEQFKNHIRYGVSFLSFCYVLKNRNKVGTVDKRERKKQHDMEQIKQQLSYIYRKIWIACLQTYQGNTLLFFKNFLVKKVMENIKTIYKCLSKNERHQDEEKQKTIAEIFHSVLGNVKIRFVARLITSCPIMTGTKRQFERWKMNEIHNFDRFLMAVNSKCGYKEQLCLLSKDL